MKNLGILVFLTGLLMIVGVVLYISYITSTYIMLILFGILFIIVGAGMIDYASKN